MPSGRFVAYYRVSTAGQGRSGLGLEAQQAAVRGYLNGGDWTLLGEFVEVESGANNARPRLAEAMEACRLKGATLVIAKLDRLSRDAAFLLGLERAGVDFVAADMPAANRITIGIMAVVADEERRMISARTKAALAASKARGTALGGWRGGVKVDGALGAEANKRNADVFAARIRPALARLQAEGLSLHATARAITQEGIQTPRGGAWSAASVRNVLLRLGCVPPATES